MAKILVPLDGSQSSFEGLEKAIYLAKRCGATVTGLYVAFLPPKLVFESIESLDSTTRRNIEKILEKAKALAEKDGMSFHGEIILGSPGQKILSYANELKFDLIVMGSRGAGSKDESFIGSVANEVLHNSKIPILIIK